jgi:hypothetical protein
MGETGLLTSERPVEIARFELAACVAVALAQLSALQSKSYSAWDLAIGAALLTTVLLASRYRSRWARIIWSALLSFSALIVIVGFVVIALDRDINLPPISNLDLFLSMAGLACNVVAAVLLWSAPASKWLAPVRT